MKFLDYFNTQVQKLFIPIHRVDFYPDNLVIIRNSNSRGINKILLILPIVIKHPNRKIQIFRSNDIKRLEI